MAFLKRLSTQFGVEAEYWKIGNVSIDWLAPSVVVMVNGFATQEASDAGNIRPLAQRYITINLSQNQVSEGGQFAQVADILNAALYGAIKAQEVDFSDAEDI